MTIEVDSRWTRALRRIFNLHLAPPLNDTLSPTFDLSNDCAEWYFARDERLLSSVNVNTPAAGAGVYSRFIVSNPVGTGRLLVVKALTVSKPTGSSVYVHFSPGPQAAALLTFIPRDSRWWDDAAGTGAVLNSAYTYNATSAAPVGPWTERFNVSGGTPLKVEVGPYVLGPGQSNLWVTNVTANESIDVSVHGYDVPLHGGEES